MTIRLEGVPCRYQEDHIAGKGANSLSHCTLVHTFVPMLEAMNIPDRKGSRGKKGKTGENPSMAAD